MKMFIIAGARIVDGMGSLKETQSILSRARKNHLRISELEIVTLAKRWEDKLKVTEFKSGASAMAAIERARRLLESKKTDLVVIRGQDLLRTGYDAGARENFMKLFNKKYTPLEGYDRLVPLFLRSQKLTEDEYFEIRDALFESYTKTWNKIHPEAKLPDERWFRPLTKYFRGVDCANPSTDFTGEIILTTPSVAAVLKVPKKSRIEIIGNSFVKLNVDGLESLPKIAPYLHLKRAIGKALSQAKIDYKKKFFAGQALLDVYSCYPIVPMALIHRLGLVKHINQIPELLKAHEVTVTGGLNLAKAPWNLTSLNAIIVMRERLRTSKTHKFGLVHGNGSLGNQQAITVLKK